MKPFTTRKLGIVPVIQIGKSERYKKLLRKLRLLHGDVVPYVLSTSSIGYHGNVVNKVLKVITGKG